MTKAASPAKRFTNPFDMFETDKSREVEGIVLNYSDVFWVKVARAGGSNDRYKSIMTEKLRPFRRAIQTDTIDEATSARVMREAVAEGLVLDWGTGIYPAGAGSIPGRDGQPIAFTVENVVRVFNDLPDFFADVYEQAGKVASFRAMELETDGKNSKTS
jgi:hypothetical protein